MAKFTPVPGLDELVARMVGPAIERFAEDVADIARGKAPPTKIWTSMEDPQVRHTHVLAHGQEIPGNLRFTLKSMDWDRQHRGLGDHSYLLAPKDESSMAVVNLINCRCIAVRDPNGISKLVKVEGHTRAGARVTAIVSAEGPLIQQAEMGDDYPGPGDLACDGTWFMHKTVAQAQAMLAATPRR